MGGSGRSRSSSRWGAAGLLIALLCALPAALAGQRVVDTPRGVILVIKGQTALVVQPVPLQRLSIADPEIAEVFAVSPREIMVNGRELGSTSLLLWDRDGTRRMYTVEVMPDTAALKSTIRELFPDETVRVVTSGGSVVLAGNVSTGATAGRIVEIAEAAGFTVINNLTAPLAPQVLLQVRFAEVSRSALREFGTRIQASTRGTGVPTEAEVEAASDGLFRFSLFTPEIRLDAIIDALQTRGEFRSLAEPNLLARDNEEASFLAGGEFPFPVVQGGTSDAVTVVWKEFGVRLRFKPMIQSNGIIRLEIAPEVSSLDFSNALRLGGFEIPSLLTRRAATSVEMREGQYLAIAGLLDNTSEQNMSKIPLLGDIPILGELFRSRNLRQRRTELLVLVSPRLVAPSESPIPLPSGEPGTWQWVRPMHPDTTVKR